MLEGFRGVYVRVYILGLLLFIACVVTCQFQCRSVRVCCFLLLTAVAAAAAAVQDHTMFPSDLWVRRLSGTGSESVYMGVLRCAAAAF